MCKTYGLSVGMSCEVECKLELILCYIVKKKLPWKTTSNQYEPKHPINKQYKKYNAVKNVNIYLLNFINEVGI